MGVFRRIWALGKRAKLDREIEEELREHMRMRIDANVAKGMSPDEAAREARLRFGNPDVMKERVDAEDAALGIDSFLRDASLCAARIREESWLHHRRHRSPWRWASAQTPPFFSCWMLCGCAACPSRIRRSWRSCASSAVNRGFGITDGPYAKFTIPMWQEVRRHHDPFSGVLAWRRPTCWWASRATRSASMAWR